MAVTGSCSGALRSVCGLARIAAASTSMERRESWDSNRRRMSHGKRSALLRCAPIVHDFYVSLITGVTKRGWSKCFPREVRELGDGARLAVYPAVRACENSLKPACLPRSENVAFAQHET